MSASATDRPCLKAAFTALLITLLCAIGGGVYELFSHGVWSGFMVYAFLFPLTLEALPLLWMALRTRPLPGRWTLNLHHAGVATLTVGSFFEGALEIYGTSHHLTIVYWIVGVLLLLGGLTTHLLTRSS